VSMHACPLTKGLPDLIRPSVRHLGDLVSKLAPRGPVLVGGDFNVHYTSGRYPRQLLADDGLVPTYDTLGAYFPTGDHHGATIDYIFDRGTDVLLADSQYAVELNSDHNAVVAGFTWQVDLPSQSEVIKNDPTGDTASQRATATAVVKGIKSAEPRSQIAVATTRLELPRVVRALHGALDRGVRVHVVLAADRLTAPARRLARHMATLGNTHNWLRTCTATCRTTYLQSRLPRGFLMVGNPDGTWRARYDANRKFSAVLVQDSSRVRISTGEVALRNGATMFRSIS